MSAKRMIAVIGGGINGAGIAWELVRRGYSTTLFDKRGFGAATSSATSKLIHGGLRYLEQLEFGLVRESLRERAFLLKHLPDLVKPLAFVIPVYRGVSRPPWLIGLGLTLYDVLAGRKNIACHSRLTCDEVLERGPLKKEALRGGFQYFDAQVDDAALVRRVVSAAVREGLDAREFTPVVALHHREGRWIVRSQTDESFDLVVIATGPSMNEFLDKHGVPTRYRLSLVRGSHLVLKHLVSSTAFLLQSPGDRRIFFALPWQERTLVGTTEVRHEGPLEKVEASAAEIEYLMDRFNFYFEPKISAADIERTTAGVRPLIGGERDLGRISRDYKIERDGRLIKVFGGKMTTFLSLARKVADAVDGSLGERRIAKPPAF